MKVETAEAFPIKIKAKDKLRAGSFTYTHYQTVLVRVVCDGEEGWGEAMTRFDPAATALMVRYLVNNIVNRDFEGVQPAWDAVWRELRVRGHTRGVGVEALSGIEIALQDCVGKIRRKGISSFFSKEPAREVGAYAGPLFNSRGPLKAQVEEAKGKGLMGAKVKVGFGIEQDHRVLAAIRRDWRDGMIVADANGAYDATTALKACRAFEGLGLAWFEEPVLSDDWNGYSALKGSNVTIGAGEAWFVGDFERPLRERLVGVLEPSVSRCGGIGVEMAVAEKAESAGIGFSPMTGMNSAISLAASLHVAAARKAVGVEFNPFQNPLQTELVEGLSDPKAGKLSVPRGPGLGVKVDRRFVKAHSE